MSSKEEYEFDGEPVHISKDGIKYFSSCTLKGKNVYVRIGDSVRVRLESGVFAFCQILSIFEDNDEDICVEGRWLYEAVDIPQLQRKRKIWIYNNELFETEHVEVFLIDYIIHSITLVSDSDNSTSTFAGSTDQYTYVCRYLWNSSLNSFQPISLDNCLERGMKYSERSEAYQSSTTEDRVANKSSQVYSYESMGMVDQEILSSSSNGDIIDEFELAIRRLHVAVLPKKLPCRENEREKVLSIMKEAVLHENNSFPLYISGLPGTGKTATVLTCIEALYDEVQAGTLKDFNFVEINCLRLATPSDAYVVLWKHLSGGECVSSGVAKNRLQKYFDGVENSGSSSVRQRAMTILLIDEIDFLLTRDERIMYDFYNWPHKHNSKLFIVAVANTIDLPERQTTRNVSRSALTSHRVVFAPYTHEQIYHILSARLENLTSKLGIDAKIIELISRRAALTGGDVRRALRICQRTLELMKQYIKTQRISGAAADLSLKNGFNFVIEACKEFVTNPMVLGIKQLCDLDKALLATFYRYISRVAVGFGGDASSISGFELFQRLGDLVNEIQNKQRNIAPPKTLSASKSIEKLTLMFPPWCVFESAMLRLVSQGLFRSTGSILPTPIRVFQDGIPINSTIQPLVNTTLFSASFDIMDVKIAFDCDPLADYL